MSAPDLPLLKKLETTTEQIDRDAVETLEHRWMDRYGEANIHSLYLAQDEPASFFADIEIDGDGEKRIEEVYVRFSRYGRLCAIVSEDSIPASERLALEDDVRKAGFKCVTEELLDMPYEGTLAAPGVETWWDRYFEYVI